MANHHPPLPAKGDGLFGNFVQMPPAGIEIEIKMEIQINVIVARHFKQAQNLTFWIGIHIGTSAKQIRAVIKGFAQ